MYDGVISPTERPNLPPRFIGEARRKGGEEMEERIYFQMQSQFSSLKMAWYGPYDVSKFSRTVAFQ